MSRGDGEHHAQREHVSGSEDRSPAGRSPSSSRMFALAK
jgi:hypothetical protein